MKLRNFVPVVLGAFVFSLIAFQVDAQSPWGTAAFQSWKQGVTAAGRMGAPRFTTALLPTCNASNLGALAYDTTLSQLVACSGSAWAGGGAALGGTNVWTGSQTFTDTLFTLQDDGDNTKKAQFQLSGISAGQTRSFVLPNSAGALTLAAVEFPNTFTAANAFTTINFTSTVAYNTRATATVDSATTFAVTSSYTVLACTGAETINTITGGRTGFQLVLENSDTECTIADDDSATAADAIDLIGTATNDVGAVAKVITLVHNGTHWLQISESDN